MIACYCCKLTVVPTTVEHLIHHRCMCTCIALSKLHLIPIPCSVISLAVHVQTKGKESPCPILMEALCHLSFLAADTSWTSSRVVRTCQRFRKLSARASSATQHERTPRRATRHWWTTRQCTSTPPVLSSTDSPTGELHTQATGKAWAEM